MDPHRHVLGAEHIALDDGGVLLVVPVVVERHDVEGPEPAGEVADRRHLHEHLVWSHPYTMVIGVAGQDVLDREVGESHCRVNRPGGGGYSGWGRRRGRGRRVRRPLPVVAGLFDELER
jgi:hypothetical protein